MTTGRPYAAAEQVVVLAAQAVRPVVVGRLAAAVAVAEVGRGPGIATDLAEQNCSHCWQAGSGYRHEAEAVVAVVVER